MENENLIRIGIFKRPDRLTVSEFRDYWHYHHGAIAINMHGMQAYDQNHVIKNVDLGFAEFNDRSCAGMSKIWFGTMDNILANDPETMQRLAIDEKYLFDAMDLVVCDERVFKSASLDHPYVKFMCLIKRKPELSEEEFDEKLVQLADKALGIPGVVGYIQNTVLSRTYNDIANEKRYEVGYEEVPVDAILEFYFDFDEDNISGDIFRTEAAKSFCEGMSEITKTTTGYLCNTYHIKEK